MTIDTYHGFKFRLKWDGRYVGGFSHVSALVRATNIKGFMPGQDDYAPITLERGVTHDPAFARWATRVRDLRNSTFDDDQTGDGAEDASTENIRLDLALELYNEAEQLVMTYVIHGCWPSEYVAQPELDANGAAVAISVLKLENEGWQKND